MTLIINLKYGLNIFSLIYVSEINSSEISICSLVIYLNSPSSAVVKQFVHTRDKSSSIGKFARNTQGKERNVRQLFDSFFSCRYEPLLPLSSFFTRMKTWLIIAQRTIDQNNCHSFLPSVHLELFRYPRFSSTTQRTPHVRSEM